MINIFCDICGEEISSVNRTEDCDSFGRINCKSKIRNTKAMVSFSVLPLVLKSGSERSFEHICDNCGLEFIKAGVKVLLKKG